MCMHDCPCSWCTQPSWSPALHVKIFQRYAPLPRYKFSPFHCTSNTAALPPHLTRQWERIVQLRIPCGQQHDAGVIKSLCCVSCCCKISQNTHLPMTPLSLFAAQCFSWERSNDRRFWLIQCGCEHPHAQPTICPMATCRGFWANTRIHPRSPYLATAHGYDKPHDGHTVVHVPARQQQLRRCARQCKDIHAQLWVHRMRALTRPTVPHIQYKLQWHRMPCSTCNTGSCLPACLQQCRCVQ